MEQKMFLLILNLSQEHSVKCRRRCSNVAVQPRCIDLMTQINGVASPTEPFCLHSSETQTFVSPRVAVTVERPFSCTNLERDDKRFA